MSHLVSCSFIVFAVSLVTGCHNCASVSDDMDAFVEKSENQTCAVDADCVTEGTGCATPQHAFCNQLAMSKTAQASAEWQELRDSADSACKKTCDQCTGLLVASCSSAGVCAEY